MESLALKFDFGRPCALVDMGSNGIRFSISDLSPPTARTLPTLYQHRAAISLYEAQRKSPSKGSIPDDVIRKVVSEFHLFKQHCSDFEVPESNIRVLATEATRNANNSSDFREAIRTATGWEVTLLSKEQEGMIGALGVASSFSNVNGLVMDLGGGSTQLTWLSSNRDIAAGQGSSVSLPYGAAALLHRLEENAQSETESSLQFEIIDKLLAAYRQVGGQQAEDKESGIDLYLSGGGFRGWGYIIMDLLSHKSDEGYYPIPIINGFEISPEIFTDTGRILRHIAKKESIFRVSDSRAKQARATALLISAMKIALPKFKSVHVSQGGVREGALFSALSVSERALLPLYAATAPFAPRSTKQLHDLLTTALPSCMTLPSVIKDIVFPATQLLYAQQHLNKEVQPASALRCTTSGFLAGTHGITHEERAALALTLCARSGSKLPPVDEAFHRQLQTMTGKHVSWWAKYLGAVSALVAAVYPAGVVSSERIRFNVGLHDEEVDEEDIVWTAKKPKEVKKRVILRITFVSDDPEEDTEGLYEDYIRTIEKVGKKKNWVDGFGRKVKVRLHFVRN